MRKIKSPWYGLLWIGIWTAALAWFLTSGIFTSREAAGLVLVWLVLVGITVYMLFQHLRLRSASAAKYRASTPESLALNASCPCGSGKKYKRCCGSNKV